MRPTSSFWLASGVPAAARASLEREERCDVAVLGAGIAGVTTAYLLAVAGVDVVLLEADAVGCGTTGHTTAKVSSAHGLLYARLAEAHGVETAGAYARLNERAIDLIAEIGEQEAIPCAFRRRDAYIYATTDDGAEQVAREVAAASTAGLRAELVRGTPLPFAVKAAMRVDGQAEFHPVDWLRGLAAAAERHGARIYERSRATAVSHRPGSGRCAVETDRGRVDAGHVVVATHFPTLDRGLFFARMSAHRSYCLAATSSLPAPEGMFLSADGPTRSLRSHPGADGRDVLIIGGEGHKVGEDDHTEERFEVLEAWARETLDVTSVEHRWSAQDAMPPDGLPYVGTINPVDDRIFVATGFAKWGMTNGTAAAAALRDRITGAPRADAAILDSNRFDPLAAGKAVVAAQCRRRQAPDRRSPELSRATREPRPR